MAAPDSALHAARAGFLARFSAFCDRSGQPAPRLSRALFGAHDRIAEIRAGSDIGVLRLARAEADLAALAAAAGVSLETSVDKPESEACPARKPRSSAP
ncbi:MAG: hypothetical protein K2X34_13490, partial [Hyphomonadaceae bacterium]|nr:hypothetical protein [Hyphomonadaceae bacterium]